MVSPMMDFSREIRERFPTDQEARLHYKLHSSWSFGELKAIRAFEFQFLETKEKYRQISRYELHLNFHSFGKELPFKIIFDLTEGKEIKSTSMIRPAYLYPDEICLEDDPATIRDLKSVGINLEDDDEVTVYCSHLGRVDSPQLRDCFEILKTLFDLSSDPSKSELITPPSQNPGPLGRG